MTVPLKYGRIIIGNLRCNETNLMSRLFAVPRNKEQVWNFQCQTVAGTTCAFHGQMMVEWPPRTWMVIERLSYRQLETGWHSVVEEDWSLEPFWGRTQKTLKEKWRTWICGIKFYQKLPFKVSRIRASQKRETFCNGIFSQPWRSVQCNTCRMHLHALQKVWLLILILVTLPIPSRTFKKPRWQCQRERR